MGTCEPQRPGVVELLSRTVLVDICVLLCFVFTKTYKNSFARVYIATY